MQRPSPRHHDVVPSGAPEIRVVTFHHLGRSVRRIVRAQAGVDVLPASRRYVLDALLVDAAVQAGEQLIPDTAKIDGRRWLACSAALRRHRVRRWSSLLIAVKRSHLPLEGLEHD